MATLQGKAPITPVTDAAPVAINPALSPGERLKVEREKRTRIPMSSPRQKLNTPEIAGFHLHWFNDDENRLAQAMEGGYDFVDPQETMVNSFSLGGDPVGTGTDLGTRVSVVVGTKKDGSTMRAYLMKIPQEYFNEDQAAGQERVDQVHDAMSKGNQQRNGETEADRRQRYVSRSSMTSTYSRRAS